jgi:hypothetical protein
MLFQLGSPVLTHFEAPWGNSPCPYRTLSGLRTAYVHKAGVNFITLLPVGPCSYHSILNVLFQDNTLIRCAHHLHMAGFMSSALHALPRPYDLGIGSGHPGSVKEPEQVSLCIINTLPPQRASDRTNFASLTSSPGGIVRT